MEVISTDKKTPITISDVEIVSRVLNGEKELFEILMRRHNQTMYRVIRSYVKADDDVKDIMQDTYIKSYQKLAQFNASAAFSTWLIRIGINEALQHLRRHKRYLQNFGKRETIDTIFQLEDTYQMNPEKEVIKLENKMLLEKAIDLLPEKYRIIFVLQQVEGLSNPEIASCLGISNSNVKVRLHRAKNHLKDALFLLSSDASIFEFGSCKCDRLVDRVMSRINTEPVSF